MMNGKHGSGRRSEGRGKMTALILGLLVLLVSTTALTVAYLQASTNTITNTFQSASVTTKVDEQFENNVKTNVAVKNTGDTAAYIRAKIVVNWKDEKGNIYGGKAPVLNQDYTISGTDSNWVKNGDYWYYKQPVEAGASTAYLIGLCQKTEKADAPDGYDLSVEIVADGIQSRPADAVKEAWGIDPGALK